MTGNLSKSGTDGPAGGKRRRTRAWRLGLAALAALALSVAGLAALPQRAAHAAGFELSVTNCATYGGSDQAGTLGDALAQAAGTSGSTITFACSGWFVVPATISVGNTLTIMGNGHYVWLSGGDARRVLEVTAAGDLTLDGLTVAQGLNKGTDGYESAGGWATGGGVYSTGTLTITNSTFIGNTATGGAGGPGIWGGAGGPAWGGGIYAVGGAITNSTFSGNMATGGPGGSGWFGRGSQGSGLGGGVFNAAGTLALKNSIVANNGANGSTSAPAANCGGAVTDGGFNLTYPGATGCPGTVADPKLGSLANNGGPTLTTALLAGSPAIGAANLDVCMAEPVNGKDQRGKTRGLGDTCDIGAYETSPAVRFFPTALYFDQQDIGSPSAVQRVTLTNSGDAPLTITGIAIGGTNPGEFAQTHICPLGPSTLAAGATCTIDVTFTPTEAGLRSASLVVNDDASGSPHAVALSGTGVVSDSEAPTTTATRTPEANGNEWDNSDVTVTLTATDDPSDSGVKATYYQLDDGASQTYTGPIVITTEGQHTLLYWSEDNAGNLEAQKTLPVNLDTTAPSVSCGSADGLWHATDVSIDCTASDGGSGLVNANDASFSLTTSVAVDTQTDNASTDSRTVTDVADNSTTAGPISGNKVDKKAPVTTEVSIAPDPNGAGWNISDVTVTLTADDGDGSGVAETKYMVNGGAEQTYDSATGIVLNTDGQYAISFWSVDTVGNAEMAHTLSRIINLDKTAPSIAISVPTDGAVYTYNEGVAAGYTCADDGSGIAADSCTGTVANGSQLDTSIVGKHAFTVTATDNAGNTATKTVTYSVTYAWSGALPPITADNRTSFRLGSTVPVKFQLTGDSAGVTDAVVKLYVTRVGDETADEVAPESNAAPDDGNTFRYDPTSDQYIYNLSTKGLTAGTYLLTLYVGGDNTTGVLQGQVDISLR